jgi:hypothetical protein
MLRKSLSGCLQLKVVQLIMPDDMIVRKESVVTMLEKLDRQRIPEENHVL